MPRNPHKKRCAKPNCRNYAMRGRHLCRAHLNFMLPPTPSEVPSLGVGTSPVELPSQREGPAPGESNHLSHGFYSRHYTIQELADLLDQAEIPGLDEEITAARIAIHRLLSYLTENDPIPDRDFQAAIALVFTGASTIGRLLRHQQLLSGEAADTIAGGIGTILEQITADMEKDQ